VGAVGLRGSYLVLACLVTQALQFARTPVPFPEFIKLGLALILQVVITDETPPQIQREDGEDEPFNRIENIEPGNFSFFGLRSCGDIFNFVTRYGVFNPVDRKGLSNDISGV